MYLGALPAALGVEPAALAAQRVEVYDAGAVRHDGFAAVLVLRGVVGVGEGADEGAEAGEGAGHDGVVLLELGPDGDDGRCEGGVHGGDLGVQDEEADGGEGDYAGRGVLVWWLRVGMKGEGMGRNKMCEKGCLRKAEAEDEDDGEF